MPLTFAKEGQSNSIRRVAGHEKTRQYLAKLGFVPGSDVKVIAHVSGNVIVQIKESRVAISREMAQKIMI